MSDLTPTQQQVYDRLQRAWPGGHVFCVQGGVGMGKTTLLRRLHQEHGGTLLDVKPFLDAMQDRHPLSLEETLEQLLCDTLGRQECVYLDDFHLLEQVVQGCHFYPRSGFLNMVLVALTAQAKAANRKLILGSASGLPSAVWFRGHTFSFPDFTPADYTALCQVELGPERVACLDMAKIHRFAPNLNIYQLRGAAAWLGHTGEVDTERFITYLRDHCMASNVDLQEVQAVDLRSLFGVDEVLESLEAHIILPLENDVLAAELKLKPRRGVLLAGPPGTGKTTVGRALAHRLKSKFFLIDGTCISGTGNFYGQISYIFEEAKRNAPAIIFVDDSDVIFESGEELGLYRYLLTMLDGLESQSVGRVCVMMTAMNVSNLPPALIRSGRIELWLEMRLPDAGARGEILRQHLAGLPAVLAGVDVDEVVSQTEGFTGADLKRLVEDGKTLYAYDRACGRPLQTITEYFLQAVEQVRTNKERYAEAAEQARQQRPARPVYFAPTDG